MHHENGITLKKWYVFSVERLDLIGILIVVIALPLSESLKNIGIGLAIAGFFYKRYQGKETTPFSLFHAGLLLFVLTALISSFFSISITKGLKGTGDIIRFAIIFFLSADITDVREARLLLRFFLVFSALAAVIALYHSLSTGKYLETRTLGNQNYTAMYMAVAASAAASMALFSDKEDARGRFFLIIAGAICLVAAVLTIERAALFGFAAFLFFTIICQRNKKAVISIAALAAVLSAAIMLYQPMRERLLSVETIYSRLPIWRHAMDVFLQHPLFGVGPNQFYFVSEKEAVFDAHSLYFQTLSQLGSLGIIGLLLIIIGFMYQWVRCRGDGLKKAVKYSALGAFSIIAVSGIFDTTLHHEHGIAFMFLTGMMFALQNTGKRQ